MVKWEKHQSRSGSLLRTLSIYSFITALRATMVSRVQVVVFLCMIGLAYQQASTSDDADDDTQFAAFKHT